MANNNYQEYVTKVFLNAEQAEDTVDKLKSKLVDLRKQQQQALTLKGDAGTKEWKRVTKEIRATESELKKLSTTSQEVNRILSNLDGSSPRELKNTIKAINKELESGRVPRNTEAWHALTEQLKRCKAELQGIEAESQAASKGGFFSKTANFLNKNWGALTQALGTVTTLSLTIRQATQNFADMEEAMANVRKYTGQTDEEIHAMNEEFKTLDTRTSREQLNELAGAAGRLGITAHDDIMEFVDAADKINVALGDDLGEGAVDQIGKLAMAFGENDKLGLRGAMLATGSAINELAQNSSANAGYLVEFMARLSGVGKQAGLTQSQIMGLGSVMDENMQQDEMASTALSQLITKMVTDTKTFATMAGVPLKKFSDMVKNDMNGALLAFFEAMNKKGGFQELAPMFADMNLDGTRATQVLSVLADKIERVKENQNRAANAYKQATSVIDEFNVQNNTVQAGIDKAKKRFEDLAVELGGKLMPIVKYTISGGGALVKILSELTTFVLAHTSALVSLTAAIVTYKTIQALANKETLLGKAYHAAIATAKLIHAAATNQLTSALALAAVKTKVLNALMVTFSKVGLAGLSAACAAAVVYLIQLANKHNDVTWRAKELRQQEEQLTSDYNKQKERLKELLPVIQDTNKHTAARQTALDELKKMMPEYFKNLDLEKAKYLKLEDVTKKLNLQLRNKQRLIARSAIADYNAAQREWNEKYKDLKEDSGTDSNTGGGTAIAERAQKLRELNELRATAIDQQKILRQIEKEERDEANPQKTKEAEKPTATPKGNNTPYVSQKELEKQEKERLKRERAAEKARKEADEKEKSDLKVKLADLANEYAQGNISYRQYLDRQEAMQLASLERRKAIWREGTSEYQNCTAEEETIRQKHAQNLQKLSDNEIERARVAQDAIIKAQYFDQTSEIYHDEDALNEALYENDMSALADRIALRTEGTEEWLQLKAEMEQKESDHQLQLQEEYEERARKVKEDYLKLNDTEKQDAETKSLEKIHAAGLLSEEEYQEALQAIRLKYAHHEPTADERTRQGAGEKLSKAEEMAGSAPTTADDGYGISSVAGIFAIVKYRQQVNEQLKQLYGEDYQNSAEYNEAKRQNNQAMFDEIVSAANAAYSGINNILSAASAYSQACSDYETAKIEADYDRQISAAGNNSKKKEKLEKKKDEAIAKAKTKANKKAMKIEIAQALASTAMAAINAYATASKVSWVLGPIAAAMATAAGMLQIATIKKQHQAEQLGYYEGGFTGGTSYRREAGVVHEGEFVANHQAVGNSSILPALQLIDYAQRHNTVSSLTGEDVSRALGQGAASPIVAAPIVNVNTDNSALQGSLDDSRKAIERLNDRLDSPIQAHISMDELDREQRKYKRLNG